MNRLQKKCIVASTGFHLLLGLILLIGPGFLASKSEPDTMPVLDFIPLKTIDALASGGGDASIRSAPPDAAPPPPPAPVPKPPEKVADPEPIKELVKTPTPEEHSLEPVKTAKPKKIEISTTPIVRKRDTAAETKARADAEAKAVAQQLADARRRMAREIGQTADNIGNGVSGGTSIKLQGPGGGGVPYANFLQAVKSVYQRAWILPDGAVDDEATTVASVTIARDGSVVASRILRSSGDRVVDRSVQATLDRVRFAAPLPDDAKEDQRTVTINFNIRAKRAVG